MSDGGGGGGGGGGGERVGGGEEGEVCGGVESQHVETSEQPLMTVRPAVIKINQSLLKEG